jgi:hypothetical protein
MDRSRAAAADCDCARCCRTAPVMAGDVISDADRVGVAGGANACSAAERRTAGLPTKSAHSSNSSTSTNSTGTVRQHSSPDGQGEKAGSNALAVGPVLDGDGAAAALWAVLAAATIAGEETCAAGLIAVDRPDIRPTPWL